MLVEKDQFRQDLLTNYKEMAGIGIKKGNALFFLPPYEWYNETIASWTNELGLHLINFTPGTRSHADYTIPGMKNYRGSESIYKSIIDYEKNSPVGLNGFILLMHIGTDPKRTDKFYNRLPELVKFLRAKGYQFQTVDNLLKS